jgi:hypothetical protein
MARYVDEPSEGAAVIVNVRALEVLSVFPDESRTDTRQ